jgi:cysteine-rich repeat protein
MSGEGGEGGRAEPCSDEGLVECASAASPIVRTCSNGIWIDETCEDGALCDGLDATCKPVIDACANRAAGDAFCEGHTRRVCGPDLVSTIDEDCEGVCLHGICRKPSCGDGKVESGESCDDGNVELGDGCTPTCRAEPIAISAGGNFACALLGDGRLKCWGNNTRGQLGLGDVMTRGDQPNELGTELPATLSGVTAFGAGGQHACAIWKSEVWCWGDNTWGQLGTGSRNPPFSRLPIKVNVAKPVELTVGYSHTCVVVAGGSVLCWGFNDQGALGLGRLSEFEPSVPGASPPLSLFKNMKSLHAGAVGTCAIFSDGLQCSGLIDPSKTLAKLTNFGSITLAGVTIGNGVACVWATDGSFSCWGNNFNGALGREHADTVFFPDGTNFIALPELVSSLAASGFNACALSTSGRVYCWGPANKGQLGRTDGAGDGANHSIGDDPGEMAQIQAAHLGTDGAAKAITLGTEFACALLKRGVIKCWGINESGQLGQGSVATRGDSATELDDHLAETVLD